MTEDGDWVERFPGLSRLDLPTKQLLTTRSAIVNVPEDTMVFGPGKSPENMLFLLDGTVRVQQVSETGHQIVLYRIEAGQSCVLTTACLLAYDDYSAEGVAESMVKAAAVPRSVFDDLVAGSKPFRDFVFAAFSKRITDLFLMIDEVAFQRVDVRLIDATKHAVPAIQVPDMLTASRPLVAALLELGHLTRIQDHEAVKSKLGKSIDGRSIQRVLKFIEGEFEIVAEAPEEHFPLAKACEKCRVTLSVILELLFGEHLKSVYRLKGQNGFAALLVSPSEIRKRLNDPPKDVSDEIRFWMG